MPPRKFFAVLFLGLQASGIAYARMAETRYFAWAPFDTQNEYRISVLIDGRALPDAEIDQRYRIRAADLESRAIAHVTSTVQYAEEHYYDDGAVVSIEHAVNGIRQEPWRWPRADATAPR